jgi:hypothetical protein
MSELKHVSRIERNIRELGKKLIDAPRQSIQSHEHALTNDKKAGLSPTPVADKTGSHENLQAGKVEPVTRSAQSPAEQENNNSDSVLIALLVARNSNLTGKDLCTIKPEAASSVVGSRSPFAGDVASDRKLADSSSRRV